jgi:hypothetical protein
MSSELDRLVDLLAERIADAVVRRLGRANGDEFVDQSTSPLGRRRHIAAIRSGALPGRQVGRLYLARRSDVEAFISRQQAVRDEAPPGPDEADELAAELGLIRKDND